MYGRYSKQIPKEVKDEKGRIGLVGRIRDYDL
jgi:hypothetical protein